MTNETKLLKVLAFSDTHGDVSKINKLAESAVNNKIDLVLMCGDFTQNDELPPTLIKPFTSKGKNVILLPGNHEQPATVDFLSKLYKVKNLHATYSIYNDVAFIGCGGANIGINQLSEKEIYDTVINTFERVKNARKKVLVTHIHPSGTIMEKMSQFFPGSPGLRGAIEKCKPDLVICGHVHEAEGVEEKIGNTKIINVARTGKIIEL